MSHEVGVNYLDEYREACGQIGCRVNSALVKTLSVNPGRPLQHINLANNYVGPNGCVPVLHLLAKCQTVESIDLSGNGLNNKIVLELCDVLSAHLGVARINLSHNPISVEAGKALMRLLEINPGIVELCVDNTDIFQALAQRISQAADDNYEKKTGERPQLQAVARPARAPLGKGTGGAQKEQVKQPKLTVMGYAKTTQPAGSGRNAIVAQSKASPTVMASSQGLAQASPSIGTPRPKPPAPALASDTYTRLSRQEREELRERYQHRAKQYKLVEDRQARREHAAVQSELQVLEAAQQRYQQQRDAQATRCPKPPTGPASSTAPRHHSTPDVDGASRVGPEDGADSAGMALPEAQPQENSLGKADRDEEALVRPAPTAVEMHLSADNSSGNNEATAFHNLNFTLEHKFKACFNLGCTHYNEGNHQAAFTQWSEAFKAASEARNREWMSLLTHNLRNLSYHIFIKEWEDDIQLGLLKQAESKLGRAQDLASHNPEWEAEVMKLRQKVVKGLFKHHHEQSEDLVAQLRQFRDEAIDPEDDRFGHPGDLHTRSEVYINERSRMLKVSDAMKNWTEAWAKTKQLEFPAQRANQQVIDLGIDHLCQIQFERYFVHDVPEALARLNTWDLSNYERQDLFNIWTDLQTHTRSLPNLRWKLVECSVMGNLALGLHDLEKTKSFFTEMLDVASRLELHPSVGFLRGAAQLFLGAFHEQRSNFADAESSLRSAATEFAQVRRDIAEQRARESNAEDPQQSHGMLGSTTEDPRAGDEFEAMATANSERQVAAWPSLGLVSHYHSSAYAMLTRALTGRNQYTAALEAHERSLVHSHSDAFYDRLRENFNEPSLAHIACVSRSINCPLVYLAVQYRHVWSEDRSEYDAQEYIYCWGVSHTGEVKFSLLSVEETFKVPSTLAIIDAVRAALCVQTPAESATYATSDTVYTETELQWREPLRKLYDLLIAPIIDFIDVRMKRNEAPCFTLIPSGFLWLVPFAALLDSNDQYLIEHVALSYGLSATQLSFSALSWRSCATANVEQSVIVSYHDTTTSPQSIASKMPFPLDHKRATKEAAHMKGCLGGQIIPGEETADDSKILPQVLPKARHIHISAPVVSNAAHGGSTGGIVAATSYDHLGVLHSADLAETRLRAELVVMTNANVSRRTAFDPNEGTLGWCRTLLGCGVPSVVMPLWCTPDMVPSEFAEELAIALREGENGPHRPTAVAVAIRRLLAHEATKARAFDDVKRDPRAFARFNPRSWAPYIHIGYPASPEKRHMARSKRMQSSLSQDRYASM